MNITDTFNDIKRLLCTILISMDKIQKILNNTHAYITTTGEFNSFTRQRPTSRMQFEADNTQKR